MNLFIAFICFLLFLSAPTANAQQISAVDTSVPVFIGYTQKAVYQKRNGTNKAISISSFSDYQRSFGGASKGYFLYESIKLYFENGGRKCFIISVGTTANPISRSGLERGIEISRSTDAQLMAIPDAVGLPPSDFYSIQNKQVNVCAELEDRFAILNTLSPTTDAQQDIKNFRVRTKANSFSFGAVYYPWLITNDGKSVPPAGAIAGKYVSTDVNKGVWKAPANVALKGVKALTNKLSTSEREFANVSSDGKSMNTLASFAGKGILIWGARTLAGNDNEWRYVPVRRLGIMLDNSLIEGLGWAVFEPNDANLWNRIETEVSIFLNEFWRKGAFQGAKPSQAFYVKCGLGKTMTAQDVQKNKVIVEMGFAPLKPAEFIILSIELNLQQ